MHEITCPEPTCAQPHVPIAADGTIGKHYRSPEKTLSDENPCKLSGEKRPELLEGATYVPDVAPDAVGQEPHAPLQTPLGHGDGQHF